MFLFEGSSHRRERVSPRDTAARFMRDLATAGVPMTLASVKAASDAVGGESKAGHRAKVRGAETERLPLIRPVGPIAGLS